ncbi:hypothetical protein [Ferrimonas gelatinilytica]|uniref:5-carboxymethyl-2-hydroxymuconate isomerase n=1 Tax=Ferrimonas gelatinilytica TaxID=1255257 RepID=A0ABP9S4G5_9GAMM
MPHLRLEYAQSLEHQSDIATLVTQLHLAALATGAFQAENIKVRALPCPHYSTGGRQVPSAHLEVKILPGRPPEQLRHISRHLLDCLIALLPEGTELSVNVCDLAKHGYSKQRGQSRA